MSVPVHQGTSCTGTEKIVLVWSSTALLWLFHLHTHTHTHTLFAGSVSMICPHCLCSLCDPQYVLFSPSELVKCPPGLVAPKATLTCSKTGKKESCSLTCASKAHYLAGMWPTVEIQQRESFFFFFFLNPKPLNFISMCDLLQSLTAATQSVVGSPSSEGSPLPGSTPAAVRAA